MHASEVSDVLLYDMRQLVGQESLLFRRAWRVLSCAKHNVLSDSIGMGVHVPR